MHNGCYGVKNKNSTSFPVYKLFPSIITIGALCIGLTSIKYTFVGKWEAAIVCIIVAAFCDGLDGCIARLLGCPSSFGAQLDSLADLINFGVAPALLLYFWMLSSIKIFGWALVMIFVACIAIRLARFNTGFDYLKNMPMWHKNFFFGVPAPAGAILSLFPVILSFREINYFFNIITPENVIVYFLAISLLVVSYIPTISIKNFRIPKHYASLLLVVFAILFVFLIIKLWIVMTIIIILYICGIPLSAIMFFYFRLCDKKIKK